MKQAYRVIVRTWQFVTGHPGAWIIGLAVISMASRPRPAWGQSAWPSYPNNNAISVTSGGNVGIGTANPQGTLHVAGTTLFDSYYTTRPAVGTSRIAGELSAIANGWPSADAGFLRISAGGGSTANRSYIDLAGYSNNLDFADTIVFGTESTERMRINYLGNVGIGTINPPYRLSVEGTIGARDVLVTNIPWSDYVLRPGFRLQPLAEINSYIQQHHHLPDIPSEAEVQEKGVSLGQMQAKLLAKVEELTLHMIQADERNNRLEQRNQELRERLAKLEAVSAR